MCESACSEGEDFPLSFSPVKLALPLSPSLFPSLSLPLPLPLPLSSSSAKSEEHMGHNSLGRDGSLEVNERGFFFSQGTRSLVSTPGYLPWHTPPSPPPPPSGCERQLSTAKLCRWPARPIHL